jgi:hypothetical protein
MADRDESPCRPRKCDSCGFNLCSKVKSKKIPPTGANGYEIGDKACKKMLCCRCTQVFDHLIGGEGSSRTQCTSCKTSTRKCCICESDKCLEVAAFDVGYEGHADENGFYCCNHRDWSGTFNSDRFEVIKCSHCEQLAACDQVQDCLLECEFDGAECSSCHVTGFAITLCDCCGQDCCTLCHQHDTHTTSGEVWCLRCAEECDREGGEFWHKKSAE